MDKYEKIDDRDLEHKLTQLPKILQIILNTEGTVTDILSTWLGENVTVQKLEEKNGIMYNESDINEHSFETKIKLDERTILINNSKDKKPLLMAVSAVYIDHLPQNIIQKLHTTNIGIGKLLRIEKVPTHREIENVKFTPVSYIKNFKTYFPEEQNACIHRRYNIYVGMKLTKKILTINEYWPASIQL